MHLLVIRPGAIGDTLLTLPVLAALKIRFAACRITFVGNRAVLPLALACGLVDVTFDYEDGRWAKLFLPAGWHGGEHLALQQVNMAICWLRDPEGVVASNLRAGGIEQIIIAPGRPAEGERVHIVEYLARTVGIQWSIDAALWSPSVFSEIPPASCSLPQPCLAIHPGSGGARKCWPVSHFAAVINALWQQNIAVLLLAGPADHERLAELRRQLAPPSRQALLHLVVDAPLLEVAQLLRQCRGYLGNDAGITHLAALMGLPTLALFGPSDPVIWRPVGQDVTILHKPSLEDIQVDTVLRYVTAFRIRHYYHTIKPVE